ncbi:MAG: hypothetical protein Q4A20_14810, partial [Actinomyces sp.]|nr:hypothetical protein [Actinomyces sp.]
MTPQYASRPIPAGCRAAPRQRVGASIAIDVLAALPPLAVGLLLPGPALLRLTLVLAAFGVLVAQFVAHCLYGRGVGGLMLGLLTVDADAGLPTGTPRSLLALMHLGAASDAVVLDIKNGLDPSRVTLDELDELAAQQHGPVLDSTQQHGPVLDPAQHPQAPAARAAAPGPPPAPYSAPGPSAGRTHSGSGRDVDGASAPRPFADRAPDSPPPVTRAVPDPP